MGVTWERTEEQGVFQANSCALGQARILGPSKLWPQNQWPLNAEVGNVSLTQEARKSTGIILMGATS